MQRLQFLNVLFCAGWQPERQGSSQLSVGIGHVLFGAWQPQNRKLKCRVEKAECVRGGRQTADNICYSISSFCRSVSSQEQKTFGFAEVISFPLGA